MGFKKTTTDAQVESFDAQKCVLWLNFSAFINTFYCTIYYPQPQWAFSSFYQRACCCSFSSFFFFVGIRRFTSLISPLPPAAPRLWGDAPRSWRGEPGTCRGALGGGGFLRVPDYQPELSPNVRRRVAELLSGAGSGGRRLQRRRHLVLRLRLTHVGVLVRGSSSPAADRTQVQVQERCSLARQRLGTSLSESSESESDGLT